MKYAQSLVLYSRLKHLIIFLKNYFKNFKENLKINVFKTSFSKSVNITLFIDRF